MNTKSVKVKVINFIPKLKRNVEGKLVKFPALEIGSTHTSRQYGLGLSKRVAIDHDFFSSTPAGHIVSINDVEAC